MECSGGAITRSKVAEGKDRANGTRLVVGLSVREVAEPWFGDIKRGDSEVEEDASESGFEKAMARRSSCSLP